MEITKKSFYDTGFNENFNPQFTLTEKTENTMVIKSEKQIPVPAASKYLAVKAKNFEDYC